jgi:pilus assembly protein CpaE
MEPRLNVLVVAADGEVATRVATTLRQHPGLDVEVKAVSRHDGDALTGNGPLPAALVLNLDEGSPATLEALAARPPDDRPVLIALGLEDGDPKLVRLAVQAGARDLLPPPFVAADLLAAVMRVGIDRADRTRRYGNVTAFMNAKGGCGATLLACNVAHMMATESRKEVCLLDFDFQFGEIPVYFDLQARRGILRALRNTEGMDEVALASYLVKHRSGLRVLGHAEDDDLDLTPVATPAVAQLLAIARATSDEVVVDLPRHLDDVARLVIEQAQHVVLVTQQAVTTLRDARRILTFLRREFNLPAERIIIALNRYESGADISIADVRATLDLERIVLIPNDYRTVSDCINAGVPLLEHAPGAAITRAAQELKTMLSGSAPPQPTGLFARALASITKRR